MNRYFILFLVTVFSSTVYAQTIKPGYDQKLADSLSADDYGMKMYMLVILKTGSKKVSDTAKRDSLFRGHMENIGMLAAAGKLVVAGPLEKNSKNYRGIFILNVTTKPEALQLLETDPAIHAKLLAAELYPWYGSAALPMYLQYHDKVQKKNF